MKRIKSYEELASLISSQLKKGVYTNCFIGKEEFELYISKKRLYYQIFEGGLLIFLKMSDYFKMKFYINNLEADLILKLSKKIVIEIPSKKEEDIEKLQKFFEKVGFNIVLNRIRLTQDKNIFTDKVNIENIEIANLKDYKKIVKILQKNYDKYTGCIPEREILKQDIINKNIYCYKINKEVVGVLHIVSKLKTSEIRHLVVVEEYRNKNIAKSLISRYLVDSDISTKYVWTSIDNDIAKKLYSKFGYESDGYASKVLKK